MPPRGTRQASAAPLASERRRAPGVPLASLTPPASCRPPGAVFFATYELSKNALETRMPKEMAPVAHSASAVVAEMVGRGSAARRPVLPGGSAGVRPRLSPTPPFLASVLAQTTGVVRIPFEIVKQQLQANMHPTPGACIKHIVNTSGVRGLFKGYVSLVSREVSRSRAASPHPLLAAPALCSTSPSCDARASPPHSSRCPSPCCSFPCMNTSKR